MTERLHFHFSLSCIWEGNGNPLQCSSLENPSQPGGLPSIGSDKVGHDWSDLAAAAAWLIINIFSVVFSFISWRWESGMCRWENSLVVCAHTCVHVVVLGSGNAATNVCVPSHRRSLPLWGTLQDKQSLLKLDFSLGFTPLFDLEIILGTEHRAYVGANLLVVRKSFAWSASASLPNARNGNIHRLQMVLIAVLLNDSSSLAFPYVWRGQISSVYLWGP